jgi:hypothetical protein
MRISILHDDDTIETVTLDTDALDNESWIDDSVDAIADALRYSGIDDEVDPWEADADTAHALMIDSFSRFDS